MFRLLALLTFASTCAHARDTSDGANHGGGGSELVSIFREVGKQVLEQFDKPDTDCGANRAGERAALHAALDESRIISVAVLTDPITLVPIPNQKDLVAWGSPGFIQLKKDSGDPGDDSWEKIASKRLPLAHHVLHELYRAAGLSNSEGLSLDDGYQISSGACHAETWPILSGGDIKDFTCRAIYITSWSLHFVEAPDSRFTIPFGHVFGRGIGHNTMHVAYNLILEKTPAGVKASGKFYDIDSGKSAILQGATFPHDQIRASIDGVKTPPDLPRLKTTPRETEILRLECNPNYEVK